MANQFTPKGQKALIVGAGTAGMASGITLSQLGVEVDLLTPGDLPPKFRAKVLAEAQPL